MPTKPTETVQLFAANATWSVGPKITQNTKSIDIGPLASEGNVPGKPNPTAANDMNRALHNMSKTDIWTLEGTFAADLDSHIIETNVVGMSSIAAINVGNTISTLNPLFVRSNNVAGPGATPNIDVVATDQVGMIIVSNHTLSALPASLAMSNDAVGISKWVMESIANGTGPDSIGGALIECNSTRTTGLTSGVSPRRISAANLVNKSGAALEAIGSDISIPCAIILNEVDLGTSLQVGYGNLSTPAENFSGNGVDSRGGDGNSTTGIGGGSGVIGTGGDAKDGVSNASGGVGVRAIGGLSATLPAAPACLVETKALNGIGLQVDHTNLVATADLVKITTGDNIANAIVVSCEGGGIGLKVDAEAEYGIHVTQIPDGGGIIAPAIRLEPQELPTSPQDGDLWVQKFGGLLTDQLQFAAGTVTQSVARTTQPYCKLTHFEASGTQAIPPTGTFVNIATLTFDVAMQPTGTTKVILKAWGKLLVNGSSEVNVSRTKWRNETAPAADIDTKTHDVAGASAVRSVEVFHMREYTITAPGPRTFTFQHSIEPGANQTTIDATNWWFEVVAIPEF